MRKRKAPVVRSKYVSLMSMTEGGHCKADTAETFSDWTEELA